MPQIRQYVSQETVRADGTQAAAAAQAGQAIQAGYNALGQSVGQGLNKFGAQYEQHEVNQDTLRMAGLAELDAKASVELSERIRHAKPEEVDQIVETSRAEFADKIAEVGQSLETDQGRAAFENIAGRMRAGYFKQSAAEQVSLAGTAAVQTVTKTLDQYRAKVAADPPSWRESTATYFAFLDQQTAAGQLPREKNLEMRRIAGTQIAGSAAARYVSMVEDNPDSKPQDIARVREMLLNKESGFPDALDADQLETLLNRLDAAAKTRANARSQAIQATWPDLLARAKGNGGVDVNGDIEKILAEVRANPSEDPVTQQNRITRMERERDEAVSYGQSAAGTQQAPQPAIDDALQAIDTKIQTAKPEELNALYARRKAIEGVAQARARVFFADPAAYVTSNSQSVAAAAQKFTKEPSPQNFATYAQLSAAEQTRLYPGVVPRLVTPELSQQIGKAIADVPEGRNGAVAAGRILNGWSQVAGRYWPQMAQELQAAKVINSDQFVAATLYSKPAAQAIAEQILLASALSPQDLATLRGIQVSDAQKAARDAFGPLAETLANSPNGAQLVKSYQDALTKVLMYRGNIDDASTVAAKMLNDEFEFRGTLRIPRSGGNDGGMIERGAETIQDRVGDRNLVIPPSASALGPNDQKRNYVLQLQNTARWYTNEDGSGAVLYDESGHVVQETINGRTYDVEFRWKQLQDFGLRNQTVLDRAGRLVTGGEQGPIDTAPKGLTERTLSGGMR